MIKILFAITMLTLIGCNNGDTSGNSGGPGGGTAPGGGGQTGGNTGEGGLEARTPNTGTNEPGTGDDGGLPPGDPSPANPE